MVHQRCSSMLPYQTACTALEAGISVLPIRADGSKQPAVASWKTYQQRLPSQAELASWFQKPHLGIALVTGSVSGNLEALDFDEAAIYEAWYCQVQRTPFLRLLYEKIASGYEEQTPAGGRHLLYYCDEIGGNQKLAMRTLAGPHERKTLIETRGEGGLIIVHPSGGDVHPTRRPYQLLRGGVSNIKTITPEQRAFLFTSVRKFNEVPPLTKPPALPLTAHVSRCRSDAVCARDRPGDVYNQHASWQEVLLPHGWQEVRRVGQECQWRRPGKEGPGISATTNWNGSDLLYVFSTSTIFEPERGYTKFHAYTLLNHAGDFAAAARELARLGYTARGNHLA